MQIKELKPRKALNKAFLKVKPNRTEIELFKSNLIMLIDRTNETESEEFHKNLVSDFLKNTYYKQNHFINTKGRNDLVIHNGESANSSVGVIIEAKKPTNKSEMISRDRFNVKSFQELVLYYLRERITHKNLEVKHLVITNINEWFIFDAILFDRLFSQNKGLVSKFIDFEAGRLSDTKTDFFYKNISQPFITEIQNEIEFTYFDFRDYQKALRNSDKADDNKLISLFKLLSPEHLLKLPFTNDSNSLDKRFYSELLHLIGLVETKEGGKKLIQRNHESDRNTGSILEDTIIQLDSLGKINRLDKPSQFGNTYNERLYNVALELSITWINRILFLKLLEAQLINYHKGDKAYSFLNLAKIKDYDELNSLFFQVLAIRQNERNSDVKFAFDKVPYLNSSLFEPTELEHITLFISSLKEKQIPVISSTVLRTEQGKKQTGSLTTLEYLFKFLDAYDFTSEGAEEIQEDNKSLINASVLGLIFEKINGYKDGSFFTPGFITMYMCRETIRKSILQKFNETKKWDCNTIEELYDKIEDRNEANNIVNSIKVCDPAVGSGHFLVSALNEIIALKNDLRILQDRAGKRLKEYHIEVVNDELIVTDEEGELFDYNPNNKESQRIQETLFHEKQTIIESCLFGVDINPNSVKICRLRLWIELLKNAYYKNAIELETLPNIDINIKCGNSLVNRFAINAELKQALKKSKFSIDAYKVAVQTYRNAENKEQKHEMERLINTIKSDFRSEINKNDKKVLDLSRKTGELFNLLNQQELFGETKADTKTRKQKELKLQVEINTLTNSIEEIKSNKIFENAFEWRFEFPDVLDDEGDFIGFDAVIGNPPYFSLEKSSIDYFSISSTYKSIEKRGDIYTLFYELGLNILKKDYHLCYITSSTWLRSSYGRSLRNILLNKYDVNNLIDFSDYPVFESATVLTNIINISNKAYCGKTQVCVIDKSMESNFESLKSFLGSRSYKTELVDDGAWSITTSNKHILRTKVQKACSTLKTLGYTISNGFRTGFNEAYFITELKKKELLNLDSKNSEIIKPLLRGRDIKKFSAHYESLYVIIVGHGMGVTLEKEYPSIYKHLSFYEKELKGRGQVKNGQHHWLELDNHPNKEYLKLFELPKITYPEITKFLPFFLDIDFHYYSNNKTFFINGDFLETLVCYLNSKLFKFLFLETFPELQGNSRELRKVFMEHIPFLSITDSINNQFRVSYRKLVEGRKNNIVNNFEIEKEIDQMIFKLFELSEEEIATVTNG
ncbi:DUF7149 domain-containing protein [Pedobacter agri]|uniref:DUF7149 domain-containing protein n=1 Tax=Pedobacter agri TaxID=454586 RepID=UPI00292CE4E0|nr:Eco57I restriction-modification methylase domain-containing protein [Pedobacter agri]